MSSVSLVMTMQDILMTNWVCPKCWLLVNISIHFIYTYIYWSDFVFLVHIQLNNFHGKKTPTFCFFKMLVIFHQWPLMSPRIAANKKPQSAHIKHPTALFSPSRLSLLPPVVFIPGVRQPRLASAADRHLVDRHLLLRTTQSFPFYPLLHRQDKTPALAR